VFDRAKRPLVMQSAHSADVHLWTLVVSMQKSTARRGGLSSGRDDVLVFICTVKSGVVQARLFVTDYSYNIAVVFPT